MLLALLITCAVACERAAPDGLTRPWPAADLALVTFQNTTLNARRLTSEPRTQSLSLGPTPASEVSVYVAVEGSDGSGATVDLDGGSAPPCVVDGPSHWQACRFTLPRGTANLGLRVAVTGPAETRAIVSQPLVRTGKPKPGLVLVILMDTVRRDRLVTFEPRIPIGTALDRLAKDGVVFDRLYSSSSWTRTAVATLLTGLDASAHGVLGRDDVLPSERDQLAVALQRGGWHTVAWSTNPNIIPLWGFARGFDVFHDVGASVWPTAKVHAAPVLAHVRAALDADLGAFPAFYYVHLMDPHAPYVPSEDDLKFVTDDAALLATVPHDPVIPIIRNEYARYLAEIRGMDRALGSLFDDLRAGHLYDDATILVVSDHGEEFRDHGGTRHGKTLYEEMLRVPAFLKLPGNALAGTRIAAETGLADLAPTLLGLLGTDPLAGASGRNLWNAEHHAFNATSATQTAVLKLDTFDLAALVADTRKLILNHLGNDQLFDLPTDPLEKQNLLPAAESSAAALRSDLDARIAREAAGWHVRVCGGDTAERQQLRVHVASELRGALLEPTDEVRLVGKEDGVAEYAADLELAPRASTRVVVGQVWTGMRPDEDELVVTAADAPRIVVDMPSGAPRRYALGTSTDEREGAEVSVAVDDPAVRVRPSTPIDCRPQSWTATAPSGGRSAYVRIWYVAPSERVPDGQVDPALQERLRALGYQR
ncbi:MAG: sulfatase [Candidatus Binatia bacterium]